MRFIKLFSLMLMITLLLGTLGSCVKREDDVEMNISPSTKNLIDLSSKVYNESELLEISKFNGSMQELNERYPIECLRKKENYYRAAYLGEGGVVIVLFDNFGNTIRANLYKDLRSKSDFGSLTVGQQIEQVMEVDCAGEYLFLYTGRNDFPKASHHYTNDGYLITIEYNDSNVIVNITEELI